MSKTSILRSIKAGRISGTKKDFGQWCIEPCELHRVYPALTDVTDSDDVGERAVTGGNTGGLADANVGAALAEQRLSDLKAMLDEVRQQRDDLRADRDAWRNASQPAQRLLGAVPMAPASVEPAAMSWWRWLRSTG
jgi:hypothetical protein